MLTEKLDFNIDYITEKDLGREESVQDTDEILYQKRLVDIYALEDTEDVERKRKSAIIGSILIDDDNYFEGIVNGYTGNEKYLVFGDYNEKRVYFHKISNNRDENEVYKCSYSNGRFYGKSIKGLRNAEYKTNDCIVRLQDADVIRTVTSFEMRNLETNISNMKAKFDLEVKRLIKNAKNRAKSSQKIKLHQKNAQMKG